MLNICITFDYELFFGKNEGSYEEILFRPTRQLADMLYEEEVSATFFADTCSVVQCEKYGQLEYVKGFVKQIQELCAMHQDVQLHIHPHWLKSVYNNGTWEFDRDSYRIHTFGFDKKKEDNAYCIIENGINYLTDTLKSINPKYQCIAFRAGGFTIQPHAKLVDALYDCGIRVDCSIAPGLKSNSLTNSYDYTHASPVENWRISSKHEWWEDSVEDKKALYEIPVATENKNPFVFLVKRIFVPDKIKLELGEKRGSYINETSDTGKKKIRDIWRYVSGYNTISMDGYKAEYIYQMLQRYYKKHNCNKKDSTIAIIGHPKLVNDIYVDNLRSLISLIKQSNEDMRTLSIAEAYCKTGEK